MTIVTITLNPCIDKTFAVERVIPERKLIGSNVTEYAGGGGINVARVTHRLGMSARAYWSCGGDIGRRLGRLIDAEAIPQEPISVQEEVRENFIIRDDSTGEQYRFGMPGPTLADADRAYWLQQLRELPAGTRFVVFSGSLPGGTSIDWYEQALRAVPESALLIVDTKREALKRALQVGVYLIKPNMHELEEFVGRSISDDAALERACREIIARGGAEVVVVSLGRGGALLVTDTMIERFSAPSVRLRSKVGAGDSMVGGLVTALAQERSLDDAVRLGVAAGTAAVMTEGTELCRKEDVERLYPSVRKQGAPR